MHKIIALLSLSFVFTGTPTFAQDVLMEQDVDQDTVISDYGKNKSRYFGSTFGMSVPVEDISGSESLERGSSYMVHYGVYYKMKINNAYSLLVQAAYQRPIYSLKVSSPDVRYQELVLNNASLALMNRFNFGQRGDFIGYYLALGASADYTLRNKMRSKTDAVDPASDFKFYKVEQFDLNYINKLTYNAEVQIGINKWVLFGKYRLTDAIDKDKTGFQLPQTTVGVLFDFGA